MAASLKIETTFTLTDPGGKTKTWTIQDTASSLTEPLEMHIPIAADETLIVWDPTVAVTGMPADFDRLVMYSDGILDVELTCNEGDAQEELSSIRLVANIPFMLGADDSFYTYTTDAFAGTLDVIDKIRVDEPESSAKNLTLIFLT